MASERISLATWLAAMEAGGTTVYGYLKPGDRFTFPHKPHLVYRKLAGGWYMNDTVAWGSRPKFRTGSGTAVVFVKPAGGL